MTVSYHIGEREDRPWGDWEVLDVGPTYVVKRIRIHPGESLSLQLHHFREEHWTVVAGSGLITIGDETRPIATNDTASIASGCAHRMNNTGTETLVFIEVQIGSCLSEDDIVRLSDSYGRD